jgi:hypothetical protein
MEEKTIIVELELFKRLVRERGQILEYFLYFFKTVERITTEDSGPVRDFLVKQAPARKKLALMLKERF